MENWPTYYPYSWVAKKWSRKWCLIDFFALTQLFNRTVPGSNDNNLPRQIIRQTQTRSCLRRVFFIMSVEKTEKTANNKYTTHQYRLAAPCLQEQVICHGKANQKYRLIWYLNLFYLLVWYKGFQKSWEFNNSWKLWTLSRGFNLTAAFFFCSIIAPFSTQLQFPPPTCGSFVGSMSKRIMVTDKKTTNNCRFSLESFLSDP